MSFLLYIFFFIKSWGLSCHEEFGLFNIRIKLKYSDDEGFMSKSRKSTKRNEEGTFPKTKTIFTIEDVHSLVTETASSENIEIN